MSSRAPTPMQVYLVPFGAADYRLYVEVQDEEVPDGPGGAPAPRGWLARLMQRFQATLAEAEAERLRTERGEVPEKTGLLRTLMRKVTGAIAKAIAEQRLLWHVRNQTVVHLHHPADIDGAAAVKETKADFSRERSKHLRWLVIDGVLVAITGPLFFFVPGPNFISWYFTFRTVGHYLSWRGARQALTVVEWRPESSPPLTDVRLAIALPFRDRRQRLDSIASALGLEHFTRFVERIASRAS